MPRPLTEPQAWRAIAKKLLTNRRIESGLCREVACLWPVSYGVQSRMHRRLSDHIEDLRAIGQAFGGYAYSPDLVAWRSGRGRFHRERALACLWMALEAEEEDRG